MRELCVYTILALIDHCDPVLLNDERFLESMLQSAVGKARMSLLATLLKRFDPQGVTGVAVLGESHIAVHTWPEAGVIFVDIGTCSTQQAAENAFEEIRCHFPNGDVKRFANLAMTNQQAELSRFLRVKT